MSSTDAHQPVPDIAVVVPTYRRAELLPRLVGALERQTLPLDRFEVIVVDNGSNDDTASVLADLEARSPLHLRLLEVPENDGPARARNLGWQATRAPLVAFTDDDCVPRPDWLAQLVSTAAHSPSLGVLQGATLRPSGAGRSRHTSVSFAAPSSRRGVICARFGSRRGKPCSAACRPPLRASPERIDEDGRNI